jgi:hypothetical protein
MSHLADSTSREIWSLDRPFSNFEFVEDRFSGSAPIRKLFSASRCRHAHSIILEKVPAAGTLAEENEDLLAMAPDFAHETVYRISFWQEPLAEDGSSPLRSDNCLGYALLKEDAAPSRNLKGWRIYEAVFRIYPHEHNYANAVARFPVRVDGSQLEIPGCLYAQQNGVNKTCAQVAIRSIISTYFGTNDLSYRKINELAAAGDPDFDPSAGLTNLEVARVLDGLAVNYLQLDYNHWEATYPDIRKELPYQKVLYSGIESRCGALMAFDLRGPNAPEVGHIIPLFGHTFNEDSWAPIADVVYFRVGEAIRYIPSRSWMSSFLVHDDNFGANLCIPQGFLDPDSVSCIFELLPEGWIYSGVSAEVAAADYFYSILPNLPDDPEIPWLRRLHHYVATKRLILRHVPITKEDYLRELSEHMDWEERKESKDTINDLENDLTVDRFWMVEVSVPEVFPTNKRKLGEILLDATTGLSNQVDGASFVLARVPGSFVFFDSLDANDEPKFTFSPSSLLSHTRLFPSSSGFCTGSS